MDGKALAGSLLKRVRRDRGLSQRALALKAGVPQPTVAQIERGHREPSISLLGRIVEANGFELQVSLRPLDPSSAAGCAATVASWLARSDHAPAYRNDAALRAVIDLRDALRRADVDAFAPMVASVPGATGDTRWDAFIASVVEDEGGRKGARVPRWTNDPERFAKPFWYLAGIPELHDWEFARSPAAFLRHGVLAAVEELESV